jgi:hypothetical protein
MDVTTSEGQAGFSIGELVVVKYKKRPLVYRVSRIETPETANSVRGVSSIYGNRGREYPRDYPVYVLRGVLNKDGEAIKNPSTRRLSGAWVTLGTEGAYAMKLEEHISDLDNRSTSLKELFVKHYTKHGTKG